MSPSSHESLLLWQGGLRSGCQQGDPLLPSPLSLFLPLLSPLLSPLPLLPLSWLFNSCVELMEQEQMPAMGRLGGTALGKAQNPYGNMGVVSHRGARSDWAGF